jgi:hypothetical protein
MSGGKGIKTGAFQRMPGSKREKNDLDYFAEKFLESITPETEPEDDSASPA